MYSLYIHITPSNKKYIGITSKDPKVRWNKGTGYKGNKHFYNAIQKYGWDNIKHIVLLTELSKSWACKIEQLLIRDLDLRNPKYGYNSSSGGEFGSFGVKRSPETIMKMKLASKGRPSPMKGKHPTEEHIQKIKLARRKSDNYGKGKKLSEEHRRKIGEAQKGRCMSNVHRQNLRKQKLGSKNPNYGKIWINDGLHAIQIYPNELDSYREIGYVRGRGKVCLRKEMV